MAKNIFYQQISFGIYCCEWVYRANFRALRVKLRELGCSEKWRKIFCASNCTFEFCCYEWVFRPNFRAL